jgi:hypothetical protein
MTNRQIRINNIINESLLKEYNLSQKKELLTIINKIVLALPDSNNSKAIERKLNGILEFYRFYKNTNFTEDKFVVDEFKTKLNNLAKQYNIQL